MTGPAGKDILNSIEQLWDCHNTLLYCMGQEAEVVLTSTGISSEDRKVYEEDCKELDEFFSKTQCDIWESTLQ